MELLIGDGERQRAPAIFERVWIWQGFSPQGRVVSSRQGLRLLQASQSAEQSEPAPRAEERRPKPTAPTCSTSVANRGKTTLKLMPNRDTTPMAVTMSRIEGVRATYVNPSRRLCKVPCFGASS